MARFSGLVPHVGYAILRVCGFDLRVDELVVDFGQRWVVGCRFFRVYLGNFV